MRTTLSVFIIALASAAVVTLSGCASFTTTPEGYSATKAQAKRDAKWSRLANGAYGASVLVIEDN